MSQEVEVRTPQSQQKAIDLEKVHALLEETSQARRGLGGQLLNASDVIRFEATLAAIPSGTRTILDAGCGLGVLTDVLTGLGYEACGVDLDIEAMQEMQARHVLGSIGDMPFPDRAFDGAIANEVLEHLPVEVFTKARMELARVATQWVIVTVPNAEPLDAASTRCPGCACTYSLHGHVRRFDRRSMETLIPGFRLARLEEVGPFKVRHRSIEWYVRRRLLGKWPLRAGAICPQCGYQQEGTPVSTELGGGRASRTSQFLRYIAGIPWKRWWLLAVYERAD
jgi:SAM-dependent methyltransferase